MAVVFKSVLDESLKSFKRPDPAEVVDSLDAPEGLKDFSDVSFSNLPKKQSNVDLENKTPWQSLKISSAEEFEAELDNVNLADDKKLYISTAPPQEYSLLESAIKKVTSILGMDSPLAKDKGITDAAKAQALIQLNATELGIPVSAYRNNPEFVDQFSRAFVDVATFGLLEATKEAATGEEGFASDSFEGYAGSGLGSFAGLLFGPAKVGEAIVSPLTSRIAATKDMPLVLRTIKQGLKEALHLSPTIGVSMLGEASKQKTFGEAASVVSEGLKSGAITGAIFGTARGMFPEQVRDRTTRTIIGLVGLNAQRAMENPDMSIWNRPVDEVIFDTAMDVFFMWKGLPETKFRRFERLVDTMVRYEDISEAELNLVNSELVELRREASKNVNKNLNAEIENKKKAPPKPKAAQRPVDVLPDYKFISQKGNYYEKIEDKWYDSKGKEVTHRFVIEAAERSKIKYEVGEDVESDMLIRELEDRYKKKIDDITDGEIEKYIVEKEKGKVKIEEPVESEVVEQEPVKPKTGVTEEPKLKTEEWTPPGKVEYKGDIRSEVHELFDFLEMGPKYKRMKDFDVREFIVEPGEPIDIPATWHDAAFRQTIARHPDGTLEAGEGGSYDTIFWKGNLVDGTLRPGLGAAAARRGTIPPGSTLYILDTGGEGSVARTRQLRIYRAKPATDTISSPKISGMIEPPTEPSSSKFRQTDPEVTKRNLESIPPYQEIDNVDSLIGRLESEINSYLDGSGLDIKLAKGLIEDLAKHSKMWAEGTERPTGLFDDMQPAELKNFSEYIEDLDKWVKDVARVDNGTQLNMMIPVNQIPNLVMDIIVGSKKLLKKYVGTYDKKGMTVGDLYRNKEIFDRTGYWLGRDGKWRYEIDDSKARYNVPKAVREQVTSGKATQIPLREVLDYDELFKSVPDLYDTSVFYNPKLPGLGSYSYMHNTIFLRHFRDRHVLIHEVQHAVNELAGAFKGSSPKEHSGPGVTDAYTQYLKVPGEMEARLAELRMNMPKKIRDKTPPWKTLDEMLVAEDLIGEGEVWRGSKVGTKLYDIGGAIVEAIRQIKVVSEDISSRWGSRRVLIEHPDGNLIYYDKGKKYNMPIMTSIGAEVEGMKIGTALFNRAIEKMKNDGHSEFYTNEVTSDGVDFLDYQERLGKIELVKEHEVPYDSKYPESTYFERIYKLKKVPEPITLYDIGGATTEGVSKIFDKLTGRTKTKLPQKPPEPFMVKEEAKELVRKRVGGLGLATYDTNKFVNSIEQRINERQREVMPFVIEKTNIPDELRRPDLQEVLKRDRKMLEPIAEEVKEHFDKGFKNVKEHLKDLTVKQIEDYVTHLWDIPRHKKAEAVAWFSTQDRFMERRFISTYEEGIKKGFKPKTLDISEIIKVHDNVGNRAIENTKYIKALMDIERDGVKLIHRGEDAPLDWIEVDYPALTRRIPLNKTQIKRKGQFVKESKVKVHPDLVRPLKAIFEERFDHPVISAYEAINGVMKKSILSLSLFHHLALAETSVALMGPVKTAQIFNPVKMYKALVRGEYDLFMREGVARDSIENGLVQYGATADIPIGRVQKYLDSLARISKDTPVANRLTKFMAGANSVWDKALWNYVHDTLKLYGYEHLVSKLDPKLTDSEVLMRKREIGQFINDTFGGQNWDALGLTPKEIQMMSWALLSSDWTVSTTRQALAPTGIGRVYKETTGLRVAMGTNYWLKAGLYFGIGMNILNALFRSWDMRDNPQYYEGVDRSIIDKTMFGNTYGNKTKLFLGRYSNGSERYLRWGKQFRDFFELITDFKHKVGGKAAPAAQGIVTFFTGHGLSGYEKFDIEEEKSFDAFKSLGESFIPISIRRFLQENVEVHPLDFAMQSGKGMTRYNALRLFKKAIINNDEELFKEVYKGSFMNNLPAFSLFESALGWVEGEMAGLVGRDTRDIEDAKAKLSMAETPYEKKRYGQVISRLKKEEAELKQGLRLLNIALERMRKYKELNEPPGLP